jgi:hypothetical protein
MAIIKKTNNKFLFGYDEKGILYLDICNINKCYHYGSQYGDSSKTKLKIALHNKPAIQFWKHKTKVV